MGPFQTEAHSTDTYCVRSWPDTHASRHCVRSVPLDVSVVTDLGVKLRFFRDHSTFLPSRRRQTPCFTLFQVPTLSCHDPRPITGHRDLETPGYLHTPVSSSDLSTRPGPHSERSNTHPTVQGKQQKVDSVPAPQDRSPTPPVSLDGRVFEVVPGAGTYVDRSDPPRSDVSVQIWDDKWDPPT